MKEITMKYKIGDNLTHKDLGNCTIVTEGVIIYDRNSDRTRPAYVIKCDKYDKYTAFEDDLI